MPSASDTLLVLPLGSTEQHGPHLPTDTDTRIAVAVAQDVAIGLSMLAGRWRATVHPAIPVGASGEHEGFAGTVSIGTEALGHVLVELGRSASAWAGRLLIVNGHGGNIDALRTAVARLRWEGRDAAWLACRTAEKSTDTHAGHAETSLLLHLCPEAVRMERAEPGCTKPLPEILGDLRSGGLAEVSPNGVLGDPTTASAAEGARLWAELMADARARVERWAPDENGMLQ